MWWRRVRRRSRPGERQPAASRWLLDRRVAALLFVALTCGLPLRAWEMLDRAVGDRTLESWLLFGDAALKMLIWGAFATFIYRRRASRRAARSTKAFVACALAILPAVLLASPHEDAAPWLMVVGELAVVCAAAFTLVSVLFLGTCFGVLPEVRGLVMRGPYRHVRHPVYLGEIAGFAGFVVASQQPRNVALLTVFVAAQHARMGMEEAALTSEFPDAYGAYMAGTRRLLPRLGPRRRTRATARVHVDASPAE